MYELRPGREVVVRNPVTDRTGRNEPATSSDASPAVPGSSLDLPREEPYRPELVARLERAVRLGRYRPDARLIADGLLNAIDALG
jgi:anti-sigma28 factor (negative regulator of flagellin synthesis)